MPAPATASPPPSSSGRAAGRALALSVGTSEEQTLARGMEARAGRPSAPPDPWPSRGPEARTGHALGCSAPSSLCWATSHELPRLPRGPPRPLPAGSTWSEQGGQEGPGCGTAGPSGGGAPRTRRGAVGAAFRAPVATEGQLEHSRPADPSRYVRPESPSWCCSRRTPQTPLSKLSTTDGCQCPGSGGPAQTSTGAPGMSPQGHEDGPKGVGPSSPNDRAGAWRRPLHSQHPRQAPPGTVSLRDPRAP